jgi:hypothetical protein
MGKQKRRDVAWMGLMASVIGYVGLFGYGLYIGLFS